MEEKTREEIYVEPNIIEENISKKIDVEKNFAAEKVLGEADAREMLYKNSLNRKTS